MWGRATHDFREVQGDGISTFVDQGVDWTTLPGGVIFNTYLEYSYAERTEDFTWFNATGGSGGVRFTKDWAKFGYEVAQLRYTNNGEEIVIDRFFFTWYKDWYSYTKRRRGGWGWPFAAVTGSTWGRVYNDFTGQEGTSLSFFVNAGLDWFTVKGATFNTFAEYRYARRSENPEWFNAYGPAVGFEFKRTPFHLGTDWYWETLPNRENSTYMYWRLYLQWYFDWNLKKSEEG